jgi:hypothetical protein
MEQSTANKFFDLLTLPLEPLLLLCCPVETSPLSMNALFNPFGPLTSEIQNTASENYA